MTKEFPKPTDLLAFKKKKERESQRSWLLLITDPSRRALIDEILDNYKTTTEKVTENMGIHSSPLEKQSIVTYLNSVDDDILKKDPAYVVALINRLQELFDNE